MASQSTVTRQPSLPDHNPTPADVYAVLSILRNEIHPRIPHELNFAILDLAKYHPRIIHGRHRSMTQPVNEDGPSEASLRGDPGLYLSTPPIQCPNEGSNDFAITHIEFRVQASHHVVDEDETYNNSPTWFEASILQRIPDMQASTEPLEEVPSLETLVSPIDAIEEFQRLGWKFKGDADNIFWKVHSNITTSSDPRKYTVR
ncbi:uncharacterized protein BKCO1_14000156 [Diplodia corticola]|uniref:Uncharacterized protein n=1 Tax=Diplodia corticola TaxID=236234 RepID=A0A1J9S621_9PEZI|nr:uncharacterized protein BKCO1_14000156 [Diplodia corticola]OJD35967.1 hypothetical protein BKCO1_14000156 [Diplodia corticola]